MLFTHLTIGVARAHKQPAPYLHFQGFNPSVGIRVVHAQALAIRDDV